MQTAENIEDGFPFHWKREEGAGREMEGVGRREKTASRRLECRLKVEGAECRARFH